MSQNEWNLSILFKSDDDPSIEEYRKEVKARVDSFVNKWANRSDYLREPAAMKQALDDYSGLDIVGPTGGDGAGTKDAYYYWLRSTQDQNNSEIKAKAGKAMDYANSLFNSLRFFKINISKIRTEEQGKFTTASELREYRHFLERTFAQGKHTLGVNEENILSLKEDPASDKWDKMLSGFLAREEREVIGADGNLAARNFSEIMTLLSDSRKEVRDSAAKAFNDILAKNSDVAEAEINALLANKKIDDELRNLPRPDSARHMADDIDSSAVDAMLDAVVERFDLARKYYDLKAKLMGVKKMEYHERNVAYGSADKEYSFEQAYKMVEDTFSGLDEDFAHIFTELNRKGHVDVFPRKGKRSGAFCTDSLKYQPTYVMLNHTNRLRDVTTFAHEFGHAINGEMMKKNRGTLDCGMALSTAEVASTFMEDFVLQRILAEADDEMKLSIMLFQLNDCITSVSRQVACYKFEQELHKKFREKGYLSKHEIGAIFRKHMEAYMGESVEQSAGSENWWIHWHHIRTFFYVYSYASGLLISKALQAKVKQDKAFIEKVKKFLSAGMSDSPVNIFKELGIDITSREFWEVGMEEVEILLKQTEELAQKLGKI